MDQQFDQKHFRFPFTFSCDITQTSTRCSCSVTTCSEGKTKPWGPTQPFNPTMALSGVRNGCDCWGTLESFQLPKRDIPNKWALFSDYRPKQASKQLGSCTVMSTWLSTSSPSRNPHYSTESPIPPRSRRCLLRHMSSEGSMWGALDSKEWKGQKKLSLPIKEGERTLQNRWRSQNKTNQCLWDEQEAPLAALIKG